MTINANISRKHVADCQREYCNNFFRANLFFFRLEFESIDAAKMRRESSLIKAWLAAPQK